VLNQFLPSPKKLQAMVKTTNPKAVIYQSAASYIIKASFR
jgi:hypothetical protein